jgi:hypothetical protein
MICFCVIEDVKLEINRFGLSRIFHEAYLNLPNRHPIMVFMSFFLFNLRPRQRVCDHNKTRN